MRHRNSKPNDAAFRELFRAEFDSIARVAFLVCGNREVAREVTQDAFTEAYSRWNRIGAYERPGAWVRKVAIRRAMRVSGRDRTRTKRETLATVSFGRSEATAAEEVALAQISPHVSPHALALVAALDELTPRQRAVVTLHYFEETPVHEIAEILGCRPSTASVHLHRARARLADTITKATSRAESGGGR